MDDALSRRRFLALGALSASATAWPRRGLAKEAVPPGACIDVRPSDPVVVDYEITQPGCYVLQEDFRQRWVFTLPHSKQPFPAAKLIDIRSSDVVLDLNGHALVKPASANPDTANAAGVTAYINGHPVRQRITVRKGRISVDKGTPVSLVQQAGESILTHPPAEGWQKRRFPAAGGSFIVPNGALDLYIDTDYVLQDLTLSSKSHAVLLQGRRNVIRRCRIIGCDSVVQSFGPDCVIEDCEIVLQYGNEFGFSKWDVDPVALRLEDGREAGYAVALHNGQDVQFSGNTVEGVRQLYQADERSSATEEGTQIEPKGRFRLRPWWLGL